MQALAFHTPNVESYADSRGRPTGRSTPWGKADYVWTYTRGVVQVATPSHGGLGISLGLANSACLSHAARAKGELKGNTFWFEEDCRWAVAAWELGPTFWPHYFAGREFEPDAFGGSALLDASEYRYKDNEVMKRIGVRQYLAQIISTWDADYFIATGQEAFLSQPQYDRWKAMREDERMRREQHPDLIVSALGKGLDGQKVILVTTADGKRHLVTPESYSPSRMPNLLSACEVLVRDTEEDF